MFFRVSHKHNRKLCFLGYLINTTGNFVFRVSNKHNRKLCFLGYLIGKFFDKDGNPTQVKRNYDSQLIEANKEQEDKEADIRRFPPCNSQFKAGHGKKLWCSNYRFV